MLETPLLFDLTSLDISPGLADIVALVVALVWL
jgi:hypothetical protein